MRAHAYRGGFTLIEILVVVAIIALLIAILLPSLARAKEQTRMVTCESNMKQLATGSAVYTVENKGRLPGIRGDMNADWLGGDNKPGLPNMARGRQPEDGTIFKQAGRNRNVYFCPNDVARVAANDANKTSDGRTIGAYSYTCNLLVSGAKVEMLAGAHYRRNPNPKDPGNFSLSDHTADMRPFPGVPVFIEEDTDYYLSNVDDSGWCNADCISDRHLKSGPGLGYGNLGYHDTHVGRIQLLPQGEVTGGAIAFTANSMCIHTSGNKWVSGRSWSERGGMYGYMDDAKRAEAVGVTHR